jgi:hypothetical protein
MFLLLPENFPNVFRDCIFAEILALSHARP